MTAEPSVQQAAAWLDIERDKQVESALFDNIVVAEGESLAIESSLQTDGGPDEDVDGPTDPVCAPIPSVRPLSAIFSGLDQLALDANLPGVGMLLRRIKMAFNDARKRHKTNAPRQQLISNLLAKK